MSPLPLRPHSKDSKRQCPTPSPTPPPASATANPSSRCSSATSPSAATCSRSQCSDRAEYLPGIRAWLDHAALPNTPAPVELDVATGPWPGSANGTRFDAAFSANTLHIMGWPEVEAFFAGLDRTLAADAVLVVYGPFNYGGDYTSDSNREFDAWLKARDPRSGIRDFEAVDARARAIGLALVEDVEMPANNRCLVWRRAG